MNLTCTLRTRMPFADIELLFRAELKRIHGRSRVEITDEEGNAVLTVTAQDIAALRAALNGVTSILGIYEKTHELTTTSGT